jgi:hypothetical protein
MHMKTSNIEHRTLNLEIPAGTLAGPLTVQIDVLEGRASEARIVGQRVSASSTASPEGAIDAALRKFVALRKFGAVKVKRHSISRGATRSSWLAIITPEKVGVVA